MPMDGNHIIYVVVLQRIRREVRGGIWDTEMRQL